jgi:hypothetical protein
MNKSFAIGAVLCLAISSIQLPATADEVWFTNYSTVPNYWTYSNFVNAERAYETAHRINRIEDKMLRQQFDALDADHDGKVTIEQVRTYHTW